MRDIRYVHAAWPDILQ